MIKITREECMRMNSRKIGAVMVIFAVMLLAAGTLHAKQAGEPAEFVPATPATNIGVVKTVCVNGFAVVYFNKDSQEYPTKKPCTEGTGGTAAGSRRVNPTNNGQGGKKCPTGTTEYQNCTPVQPLPCCYTNAN